MKQGKLDDAIVWLERAKAAPRYEPRHFPFLNLGRIYAAQGQLLKACAEFEGALRMEPDNRMARRALEHLRNTLN
jgi:Tfp pilus assembly protein PilF